MIRCLYVIPVCLLVLPGSAVSESMPRLRDVTSVRAAGMGGATAGFAVETDALHVNPAAIASGERFNASVGGFVDYPQRLYLLSIEAVDSKMNSDLSFPISGGLSYMYFTVGQGFEAYKGHVAQFALAAPIFPNMLFVGLTTRYLHLGGSVVSNAVTTDAAMLFKPAALVGISAQAYNIISVASLEAPRGFAFGVGVGKEERFHVGIDLRLDEDPTGTYRPTFKIGGEYLIADIVAPRLGYVEDRYRDAHLVCVGVSVQMAGWAIEASYQHAVGGLGKGIAVGLALRLLDLDSLSANPAPDLPAWSMPKR